MAVMILEHRASKAQSPGTDPAYSSIDDCGSFLNKKNAAAAPTNTLFAPNVQEKQQNMQLKLI
jgi:hypothetical protein